MLSWYSFDNPWVRLTSQAEHANLQHTCTNMLTRDGRLACLGCMLRGRVFNTAECKRSNACTDWQAISNVLHMHLRLLIRLAREHTIFQKHDTTCTANNKYLWQSSACRCSVLWLWRPADPCPICTCCQSSSPSLSTPHPLSANLLT